MIQKILSKKRFIKFCFTGLLNSLINYIVYAGLLLINLHYALAYLIAYLVATANSYIINNFWVFKHKENTHVKKFGKFLIITAIVLGIAQLLLFLFVDIIHIQEYISGILVIPITGLLNYLLYKKIVFK